MPWELDDAATHVAQEVFPDATPRVRSNGRQLLLTGTPLGRVVLIPVVEGVLVAVEQPPSEPRLDPRKISPQIRLHLKREKLTAWKVVPAQEAVAAIRQIPASEQAAGPDDEQGDSTSARTEFAHASRSPTARLIGDDRITICNQLEGLLAAKGPGTPLPQVLGPAGCGRKLVVETAAKRRGLSMFGELSLGQLWVPRALRTPCESLLDGIHALADTAELESLVVITGAELLAGAPPIVRQELLHQFSHLPNVVLVGSAQAAYENVIPLPLPGLNETDEALALLQLELPRVALTGAALPMLCRAASEPPHGILPGRLLYLVRLALTQLELAPSEAGQSEAGPKQQTILTPDDVSLAIELAGRAWPRDDHQEHAE